MRPHLLLLAGLLVAAAPITMPRAWAQVTLDLHALDQGPAPSPAPNSVPKHARTPHAVRPPTHRPAAAEQHAAKPSAAQPAAAGAPVPALPVAPPSTVALAPIIVQPPAAKPEPPPVAPISPSAGSAIEPIDGGLRVLFAPSRTDLTPNSEAGIRTYLDAVPRSPATTFNVIAYAAGPPEDPSTPRRLSLSRALAVRSVLMADGIRSEQIYLRALGTPHGGGPDDRVDLTALGTNAGAQATGTGAGK